MPDPARPWAIIMLAAGGLFTGGLVWYAWERVWIWRRLSLAQFAVDFRRSVRKADPAMPILLVVCGGAAGVFASFVEGGARTLALLGVGLLAVILVSSILVAEPINSQFRGRAEGTVPPEAERLRRGGDGSTSFARAWAWPPSGCSSRHLHTAGQRRGRDLDAGGAGGCQARHGAGRRGKVILGIAELLEARERKEKERWLRRSVSDGAASCGTS